MGRYRHVPLPEEAEQQPARRDGWATWGPTPGPCAQEAERKNGRRTLIVVVLVCGAFFWGGPIMALLVIIPLSMASYGPFKAFGQSNRYGRWDYGRGRAVATEEQPQRDPLHPYDEV